MSLVNLINKRRKPGILFISLFTVQTSDYDVIIDFCVDSASVIGFVIQKVQRHHDLIKAHAVRDKQRL